MRTLRSFALLLVVVIAAACDDDVTGPRLPADVSFDASLGVDLAAMTDLGSGLYVQTLTAGSGGAFEAGDAVVLGYTLWLPDGTEIDSNDAWTTTISAGSVIDGFLLGLEGMSEGETRLIVIPSALGYGAAGNRGIPPHSVLVFRVTLHELNPPA